MDEADRPKDEKPEGKPKESSPPQAPPPPERDARAQSVSSASEETESPAKAPKAAARPAKPVGRTSLFQRIAEPEEVPIDLPTALVRARTRRDFLLFGAGTVVAAAGFWWLLPDETKQEHLTPALRDWLDSLEGRVGLNRARRERFLNRAL